MGDPLLTNQPITFGDVVFSQASPEQMEATWELNGVAWAAPMAIRDYIAREAYLFNQQLCWDGGCKVWVLALRADPAQIVAACETTRKDVLIAEPRDSRVRWARGSSIASVYTNPRYRRLGMAAYLLRCVQGVLDDDAECSALYSEIGRVYYRELGWPVFPSAQVTLQILGDNGDGGDETNTRPFRPLEPGRTRYLTKTELPELCEHDVDALVRRFETITSRSGNGDDRVHVAFAPSWPQIGWQLAREEFMARALFDMAVERRGAITVEGTGWIYWEHDWRAKMLKVLRVVTPEPESEDHRVADVIVLLEAAVAEAAHWGLRRVLLWNPDEALTLGAKGVGNAHDGDVEVVFDERLDTAIPSFRWRGGEERKTVWEENFYYCWC